MFKKFTSFIEAKASAITASASSPASSPSSASSASSEIDVCLEHISRLDAEQQALSRSMSTGIASLR